MVATDCPEASRVGADVLEQGGNAFDAAIATSLALAVCRPQSTGLGGGGFMVAWVAAEHRIVVLDFRETAPAAATAQRYTQLLETQPADRPPATVFGGNAVAVPGQLAGLAEIQRRWASWPLAELIRPVIDLAERGLVVDEDYQQACNELLADVQRWPQLESTCRSLRERLVPDGRPPPIGRRIPRPDLAEALRLIAERGPEVLYDGAIGDAIVQVVQAAGGQLTRADLGNYQPRRRQPLLATWRGYQIATMPPPSSGGVCLIEALNILDQMASDFPGGLPAVREDYYPSLLVCALKHAFADRARWLGDPDFTPVPTARLISRDHARQLASRRCPPDGRDYGSSQMPEDGGTSHFCVADRSGNLVALTETINGNFGSLLVADPYGILLNNEMDDFATQIGKPNLYGLIQGAANAVAPGKRPLSSMSPTIVLKDGRPLLALGASGGPRIITSVTQVLLNVIEFDMPLDQAMSAVRIHHQWQPDEVYFDQAPPPELTDRLQAAGHTLSPQRRTGIVQAIQFLPDGTMVGASDPRKGGRPAAPG